MAQVAITLDGSFFAILPVFHALTFEESHMGFAMFTFNGLLAPLQNLVGWFMASSPARARRRTASTGRIAFLHCEAGRGHVAWPPAHRYRGVVRPVRVVRVVDAAHAPASAGRMVISGRMADVCAELDRLAASEATRH